MRNIYVSILANLEVTFSLISGLKFHIHGCIANHRARALVKFTMIATGCGGFLLLTDFLHLHSRAGLLIFALK